MEYDLVFEGGGAKGMVFVGALREFERQGHTFDRLLGTSAGAITATLLAAGFDSAEMLAALDEEIAGQSVFAGFMEAPSKLEPAELEESQTRELLRQLDLPLLPAFIEVLLVTLARSLWRSFTRRRRWLSLLWLRTPRRTIFWCSIIVLRLIVRWSGRCGCR